ncbi:phenylacetate-CoA ligase [Hydrogenoanaerobacterium saccharovorans]|uniref:Phenylacetate-coenzyme A ligase n=1 Tax=Hydrogenoanaerobacterium saccharovorans TaxID=474960 RepID=A0A1H7ZDZ4_9FIRM|nr:phenylacetate--CoA ligase [Hydrogenoanaerobacterium saccharovorans]RPF48665.1 phenylacetate-CoA ligase [Hydrogenoanaerobacterium saccharovorans]SEM56461.1 phenylacetate-CoA ligase [Hydrogenoanaerobacterium saccharovorans]
MPEKYWNSMETAPLHEIRALQSLRLSQTVRHAYNNISFYKKKFDEMGLTPDDIQSIDDLHKLPFTYKQDLRDNYPYGLFAVPQDQIVRIHASSGTTGKQTVVGYTANDLVTWSDCCARALTAAGGDSSDYVHVSYGYGLFTGGMGLHYGAERIKATVIPASVGNTQRQIQVIRDFGSSLICCTPSYAIVLGETMRDMGISTSELKLKAGIFGAEPWTEEMRHKIESLLNIKAYDIYGLSEVMGPGVSFECSEQTGMHVNEDHFIPEIINPETGEVLPDGEQGELVFTAITKEALPLLRYRTRDIASLSRKKCSCGRTLIKMTKPAGRTDDMLIIRGVNVFPSQIESVLLNLGMAPHYQLIIDRVNNLDVMEVLVEMNQDMEFDAVRLVEKTEARIKAAIDSTLGISAKVHLVSPKTIERSEGKSKRVVDKRKLHD